MGRPSTKEVKIGQIFHTWRVIAKEEGKYNYNYICECINCGITKSINKHNLLRNSYALCKSCGVKSVLEANMDEIMTYWNPVLNGNCNIDEILSDPSKTYWFTCEKGHNFRKTIRDFTPEECPTCKTKFRGGQPIVRLKGDSFADNYPHLLQYWNFRKNKDNPKEVFPKTNKKKYWFICSEGHEFERTPYQISKGRWCPYCDVNRTESRIATLYKQVLNTMYEDVKTENDFPINVVIDGTERVLYPDIIIEDIKVAIEIHGMQHYKYSKGWHNSESDFVDQVKRDRAKKKWLEDNGYTYYVINATENFEDDVDFLKEFVVKLTR